MYAINNGFERVRVGFLWANLKPNLFEPVLTEPQITARTGSVQVRT